MELETNLSEQRRPGFLRDLGKGAQGSQANESELSAAFRNFGSMPCSQAEMEKRTAGACDSPNRLQRRTGESSWPPEFACHDSTQADQFGRCSRTTFSHRL